MGIKVGDRITVTNSLLGIYNDKKGTVTRVIGDHVEVILDINKGAINEKTLLPLLGVEVLEVVNKQVIKNQETPNLDCDSIDNRLDNVEVVLNKYGLSIKDGCGFMYIYDFLDTLGMNWSNIQQQDKEFIAYCLFGENFKLN